MDSLPGVLLLEVDGAAIAKGRVQPLGIVDIFDEVRQSRRHVVEGSIVAKIHLLDFQGFDKALGLGVIVGIAAPAHRTCETIFGKFGAVVRGGILAATIGMVDAAGRRIARGRAYYR